MMRLTNTGSLGFTITYFAGGIYGFMCVSSLSRLDFLGGFVSSFRSDKRFESA
jgi:hypothetical protein